MNGIEALNKLETKLQTAAADERKIAANWVEEEAPATADTFFIRAEGVDIAIAVLVAMRDRLQATEQPEAVV